MLIWLMGLRFECMDELRDGMGCNYTLMACLEV